MKRNISFTENELQKFVDAKTLENIKQSTKWAVEGLIFLTEFAFLSSTLLQITAYFLVALDQKECFISHMKSTFLDCLSEKIYVMKMSKLFFQKNGADSTTKSIPKNSIRDARTPQPWEIFSTP